MRVLLSFEFLEFAGTETYTLTVARELERLGHEAAIYSPDGGALVESARASGFEVFSLAQIRQAYDLIIANDAATALDLRVRFRDVVMIFVAHSVEHMLQAPPQIGGGVDAIVVLNDRVAQAVQARAFHAPVVRLRQPIDRLRFSSLSPARPRAETVLVSTNYVVGPRFRLIEEACRRAGLQPSWIGSKTTATPTPELAISAADIVIGLGRSALEGMAAHRATYVYGILGGDGWVTPDRYPAIEANGFAGTAYPEVMLDVDRLTADLQGWTPDMGEVNSDLICAHHGVHAHAAALVALARELGADPRREVSATAELARLVRLQWRSAGRASSAVYEASGLRSRLAERDRDLSSLLEAQHRTESDLAAAQALRAQAEQSQRQVEATIAQLRGSRRYRLACRVAAPLDRLRAVQLARHDARAGPRSDG